MAKSVWQPPRLRVGETAATGERRATWLELFFDLVFVVAIAELAHNLSENVSVLGFVGFAFLFAPVWWCWVGATFYATRFDTDDLSHRLLTLLQMAIVAMMAVNIHYALGKSSVGFALSYVAFRVVLVFQYLNAGHHIPIARSLTTWYARGFILGALIWVGSVFVPPPWRFVGWALGMIVDLSVPLTARRHVARIPPDFSHIPERVGLFIIIVLGETILGLVQGSATHQWTWLSILSALFGLSIAFSLWWIYFDTVDGSPLRAMQVGKMSIGLLWLYSHLPLAIALTATGVGVEHVIKDFAKVLTASDRWLLCGSVALSLVVLAFLHRISCALGGRRNILVTYRLVSATVVLLLAIAGGNLPTVVLVSLLAIACATQVILGLFQAETPAAEA